MSKKLIDLYFIDVCLRSTIRKLNGLGFVTEACCQGRRTIKGCEQSRKTDKGHGIVSYIVFKPAILPDLIIDKAKKLGLVVSEFGFKTSFNRRTGNRTSRATDFIPAKGKWNKNRNPRISSWDCDNKALGIVITRLLGI